MKLSPTQKQLLSEIVQQPKPVADHYAPAKKLVAMGLAEWVDGKFGGSILHSTAAGKAAISIAPR